MPSKPSKKIDAPIVIVDEQPSKEVISTVAPIESVEETPKQSTKIDAKELCWNCQSRLVDNKCDECGFNKELLYNLDLEAEEAIRRQNLAIAK